jgi:hypothetical protein
MPRKIEYHTPDGIDCYNIFHAIVRDFGLLPEVETRYENDTIVVLVRCRKPDAERAGVVQVQAMVKTPFKTAKSLWQYQYGAMLDCWHQCDRGLLANASTPITRDWLGRPRTPERSTNK